MHTASYTLLAWPSSEPGRHAVEIDQHSGPRCEPRRLTSVRRSRHSATVLQVVLSWPGPAPWPPCACQAEGHLSDVLVGRIAPAHGDAHRGGQRVPHQAVYLGGQRGAEQQRLPPRAHLPQNRSHLRPPVLRQLGVHHGQAAAACVALGQLGKLGLLRCALTRSGIRAGPWLWAACFDCRSCWGHGEGGGQTASEAFAGQVPTRLLWMGWHMRQCMLERVCHVRQWAGTATLAWAEADLSCTPAALLVSGGEQELAVG